MNTFRRPNVLLIYTDQQRGERLRTLSRRVYQQ